MPAKIKDEIRKKMQGDVWLVYDGECPICNMAANALQIKKTVGNLHLINAREARHHPVVAEVTALNLNLDDGMALKFQGVFYHGQDALHMMAALGGTSGLFNRINALLFRSRTIAKYCYPVMRGMRNLALRLKGAEKINNLRFRSDEPIFKAVFGNCWNDLPPAIKKHYAVRAYCDDMVTVEGRLDVRISPLVKLFSLCTGMLLSHSGENISVTVKFRSGKNSGAFHFERIFHFPDHGDVIFHSRMERVKDNILIEFMRYGIGWKLAYEWDGEKVILRHKGYVWRIFGFIVPFPGGMMIGKGYAEETPLSEDHFNMHTHAKHPLFGKTFGYAGEFKITEVSCGDPY